MASTTTNVDRTIFSSASPEWFASWFSTARAARRSQEDIGDENPVAIYVPGIHAHGYEALTDALFAYLVTEEYDAEDPDEHGVPWDDLRVKHLWSVEQPILSARDVAGGSDAR